MGKKIIAANLAIEHRNYSKNTIMSCNGQLQAVETCVKADPATCDCFDQDNFQESFKKDAANAFKSTLAFKPPTDPDFCVEANFRTCKPFTAPSGDLVSECSLPPCSSFERFLLTPTSLVLCC